MNFYRFNEIIYILLFFVIYFTYIFIELSYLNFILLVISHIYHSRIIMKSNDFNKFKRVYLIFTCENNEK